MVGVMSRCHRIVLVGAILLAASGCATISEPQRGNLASADAELQTCARWYKKLDAAVTSAGVGDVAARRIDGFPYLRVDRFSASFREAAAGDEKVFAAWVAHMQALATDSRNVEIANLPETALTGLDVQDRRDAMRRSEECSASLAAADFSDGKKTTELLQQRALVEDDYSSFKRALGFYAILQVPFSGGIEDWHEEAIASFKEARAGQPAQHPLVRFVPPPTETYDRAEVSRLLAETADPLGIPALSEQERERLFATYAPVIEIESSGDYDRIGRMVWTDSPAPAVDIARPTVYRKLAYTRVQGRTLVQLVYVAWLQERPKDGSFDLLGGRLDGIVWRVTLAPDGEPVLFDTIHPCGCFHMFFPTPRAEPIPAPGKYEEWAFSPASLPAIAEGSRVLVSAETRTHYLRNVWPVTSDDGIEYAYADYDDLRTLPQPDGGSRSAFGPDGLVPGTERGERFLFWPMGIASAGAMRQWGTHATAFLGRRHFDDADLIERRFRLR